MSGDVLQERDSQQDSGQTSELESPETRPVWVHVVDRVALWGLLIATFVLVAIMLHAIGVWDTLLHHLQQETIHNEL